MRRGKMSDKTNTSGRIGVTGLLGVAFVVLKLCHVIEWPWLWVLAPFWVPFAIVASVIAVLGVVWLFLLLLEISAKPR
jgi:hypothetical protein